MSPYRTNSVGKNQAAPSFDRIANMSPAPVKKKVNVGKYVITYHYLDVNDKKRQHKEEHVGSKIRVGEYDQVIDASNPLHFISNHGVRIFKDGNFDSGGTYIPPQRILQADIEYEEYHIEIDAKP